MGSTVSYFTTLSSATNYFSMLEIIYYERTNGMNVLHSVTSTYRRSKKINESAINLDLEQGEQIDLG